MMTDRRVLCFGAAGQLGTALHRLMPTLRAVAHNDFDIVTGDAAKLLSQHRPDVVVNCAAFHNVDRCEREPEPAFATNAIAVDRLATACAAQGVVFVTASTDYVFSGADGRAYTEADVPAPRTVYGASKAAGEMLTRRHGPRHIIVRTSGVFGTTGTSSKGYTLIDRVLGQAERGEPTRMVADMTFSPTYAPHLACAIVDLIEREAFGTHHVTNVGACTWYDFVRTAFAKAGLADAPLEATTYTELGNPTPRPMYSPLENTTFAPLGLAPMPSWETALDDYLSVRSERVLVPPDRR